MTKPILFVLLLLCPLALQAQRFEVSGTAGWTALAEPDNSGGRGTYGLGVGVRLTRGFSLLGEFMQMRHDNGAGTITAQKLYSLDLLYIPQERHIVSPLVIFGIGGGSRDAVLSGLKKNDGLTTVFGGVGANIDVTPRFFIRPQARLYFWAPNLSLGVSPMISAGVRF